MVPTACPHPTLKAVNRSTNTALHTPPDFPPTRLGEQLPYVTNHVIPAKAGIQGDNQVREIFITVGSTGSLRRLNEDKENYQNFDLYLEPMAREDTNPGFEGESIINQHASDSLSNKQYDG